MVATLILLALQVFGLGISLEKHGREKEAYIKEVAQKYYDEGEITERVYDALIKYEVEITD